jgi:hypothetical protein
MITLIWKDGRRTVLNGWTGELPALLGPTRLDDATWSPVYLAGYIIHAEVESGVTEAEATCGGCGGTGKVIDCGEERDCLLCQ